MAEEKPSKRAIMEHLLEKAWVFVHLDARREGVDLPEDLRGEKHLILQYGYNMPVPIVDLVLDERGIAATLSFHRVPRKTLVPWSAVFAIVDGDRHGFMWEEDLPADLSLPAPGPEPPAPPQQGEPPSPWSKAKVGRRPRPGHLKLVD